MEETEIDELSFHGLRSLCKDLKLVTSGKKDELRQRLKDHFLQPPTPRLSDIDEEDGEESDESGESVRNPRRSRSSIHGRSAVRARSLSRGRRNSIGGGAATRRRSISTPKTPTPINDLLMRSEEPYEASPQRTDQIEIERRLSIIEGSYQQWDAIDRLRSSVKDDIDSLADDIASLAKKTDERQNESMNHFKDQVKQFLKKHFQEQETGVSASIDEAKVAVEKQIEKQIKSLEDSTAVKIESSKEELSQSVKNAEEKFSSTIKTVDEIMDKNKNEMCGKYQKLSSEIDDICIVNGNFVDEFKLLNQKMAGLKSELSLLQLEMSGLRSWNRILLFMFLSALIVQVQYHIDVAGVTSRVSNDVLAAVNKMYTNGVNWSVFNLHR